MVIKPLRQNFWKAAWGFRHLLTTTGIKKTAENAWMQKSTSIKTKLIWHRLFPVRKRYVTTRHNRLRLRYVASTMAIAFASIYAITAMPTESMALRAPIELNAHPSQTSEVNAGPTLFEIASAKLIGKSLNNSASIHKAAMALKKIEPPSHKDIKIKSGQTIAGILQKEGLNGAQAYWATKALSEHYNVRKIRPGQKISIHYRQDQTDAGPQKHFDKLVLKLSPIKEATVKHLGEKEFKADLTEKELFERVHARKTQIETTLSGSAARANIPSAIVAEMIRIYSWNVDFQRDIRSGDKIEVLYEAKETKDGNYSQYGNILFANLSIRGRDYPIYRFKMDNGRIDYFEPDGISIRKTLMKTPVDGARISSGFGMRKHPVLGYNKMHKGMDFAAPTGTPIYAAGDGTIERAGRNGGYGNYVKIRHNSKLKTAYAHLHKIKSGIKSGTHVRQGQVIGTVGTTGRSTGPHLHYEVLLNNRQVNPRSVKLPTGEQLKGNELNRFRMLRGDTQQQYVSLSEGLKFASASENNNRFNN